jgi:hypothetical protein
VQGAALHLIKTKSTNTMDKLSRWMTPRGCRWAIERHLKNSRFWNEDCAWAVTVNRVSYVAKRHPAFVKIGMLEVHVFPCAVSTNIAAVLEPVAKFVEAIPGVIGIKVINDSNDPNGWRPQVMAWVNEEAGQCGSQLTS